MAAKLNCWEVKRCGREPGGARVDELGVCPASTDRSLSGLNAGECGGRACWAVTGTLCRGSVQGTFAQKQYACTACTFFTQVQAEEGDAFTLLVPGAGALDVLQRSESHARAVFEAVPLGLFRATVDGRLLSANPALAQCLGVGCEATLANLPLAAFYAEREDFDHWLAALGRGGLVRGFQARFRRFDGSEAWLATTARLVYGPTGLPLYIEGACEDVTERVELSRQLERVQAERDHLTQMVVHDLRSSLTAMAGFVDLVGLDPRVPADLQELTQGARGAVQSMADLANSLLDIARLEAGEPLVNPRTFDLAVVVDDAVGQGRLGLGRRRLEVALPTAPVPVAGDADMLRRVVQNLLGNAIKFTDGVTGRVGLRLEADGASARLTVVDNGPGIALADRDRVFDRFFTGTPSAPGARAQHRSTGLGLNFAKLATEAHGGRIGVEGEPSGGTRFWLELPTAALAG